MVKKMTGVMNFIMFMSVITIILGVIGFAIFRTSHFLAIEWLYLGFIMLSIGTGILTYIIGSVLKKSLDDIKEELSYLSIEINKLKTN